MTKFIRFFPAILLVIYIAIKVTIYAQGDTDGGGEYVPTSAQRALLHPVQEVLKNHPDAAEEFTNLFYGLSVVVIADSTILKSTDDVRRAHNNAGAVAIQVGEIPRIPGFSGAVDSFLAAEIGTDNVPLDAAKRNQIGDAFKALSWAAKQ